MELKILNYIMPYTNLHTLHVQYAACLQAYFTLSAVLVQMCDPYSELTAAYGGLILELQYSIMELLQNKNNDIGSASVLICTNFTREV